MQATKINHGKPTNSKHKHIKCLKNKKKTGTKAYMHKTVQVCKITNIAVSTQTLTLIKLKLKIIIIIIRTKPHLF